MIGENSNPGKPAGYFYCGEKEKDAGETLYRILSQGRDGEEEFGRVAVSCPVEDKAYAEQWFRAVYYATSLHKMGSVEALMGAEIPLIKDIKKRFDLIGDVLAEALVEGLNPQADEDDKHFHLTLRDLWRMVKNIYHRLSHGDVGPLAPRFFYRPGVFNAIEIYYQDAALGMLQCARLDVGADDVERVTELLHASVLADLTKAIPDTAIAGQYCCIAPQYVPEMDEQYDPIYEIVLCDGDEIKTFATVTLFADVGPHTLRRIFDNSGSSANMRSRFDQMCKTFVRVLVEDLNKPEDDSSVVVPKASLPKEFHLEREAETDNIYIHYFPSSGGGIEFATVSLTSPEDADWVDGLLRQSVLGDLVQTLSYKQARWPLGGPGGKPPSRPPEPA